MKKTILLTIGLCSFMTLFSCVKLGPAASFRVHGNNDEMVVPYKATFLNLSTNADSYEWDFGDGTKSTAFCPVHTYTVAGKYTITLTAKGENSSSTNSAILHLFNETN